MSYIVEKYFKCDECGTKSPPVDAYPFVFMGSADKQSSFKMPEGWKDIGTYGHICPQHQIEIRATTDYKKPGFEEEYRRSRQS